MTKTPGTIGGDKQALSSQRWLGVFLLLIGFVMGYFSVFRPLQDAAHHALSVSLETKAIGATPMILLFGFMQLLFPRFAIEHMGGMKSRTPKTAAGWVFLAMAVIVAIAFSEGMEAYIRNLGYSV